MDAECRENLVDYILSDPYTLTKIFEVNETRIFLSEFQSETIVSEYTIQCFLGIIYCTFFFGLVKISSQLTSKLIT